MIRKFIKACSMILLLPLLFISPVSAAETDTPETGSVILNNNCGESLSGAVIGLYQIASVEIVNGQNTYVKKEGFEKIGSFDNLDTESFKKLVETQIIKNKVMPVAVETAGDNGLTIDGLEKGVYYLCQYGLNSNGRTMVPFIFTIPNGKNWDINSCAKTTIQNPGCNDKPGCTPPPCTPPCYPGCTPGCTTNCGDNNNNNVNNNTINNGNGNTTSNDGNKADTNGGGPNLGNKADTNGNGTSTPNLANKADTAGRTSANTGLDSNLYVYAAMGLASLGLLMGFLYIGFHDRNHESDLHNS